MRYTTPATPADIDAPSRCTDGDRQRMVGPLERRLHPKRTCTARPRHCVTQERPSPRPAFHKIKGQRESGETTRPEIDDGLTGWGPTRPLTCCFHGWSRGDSNP